MSGLAIMKSAPQIQKAFARPAGAFVGRLWPPTELQVESTTTLGGSQGRYRIAFAERKPLDSADDMVEESALNTRVEATKGTRYQADISRASLRR